MIDPTAGSGTPGRLRHAKAYGEHLGAPARRDVAGQAMLELVIVLPLLLGLIFTVIEFGFILGRYQVIANASREGARTASLYRQPCRVDDLRRETNEAVQRFSGTLGMTLGVPEIVGSSDSLCDSTTLTVTVSFRHPITFLSSLIRGTSVPLSSQTTMMNERRIATTPAGSTAATASSG